jgi:hypothetical protein
VAVERCAECGFDAEQWSDARAVMAIGELPGAWADAVDGLTPVQLGRRPVAGTWSIAEYVDHVREVLFAMRFLVDTASSDPGTDLGPTPTPSFDAEPRVIDVAVALEGVGREAGALTHALTALPSPHWARTVTVDGTAVDVHWVARHAVHDATHHLLDVARLRVAL